MWNIPVNWIVSNTYSGQRKFLILAKNYQIPRMGSRISPFLEPTCFNVKQLEKIGSAALEVIGPRASDGADSLKETLRAHSNNSLYSLSKDGFSQSANVNPHAACTSNTEAALLWPTRTLQLCLNTGIVSSGICPFTNIDLGLPWFSWSIHCYTDLK